MCLSLACCQNIQILSRSEPLLCAIGLQIISSQIVGDNHPIATWLSHSMNAQCILKRSTHDTIRYNSVTYLSQESRRGISSLGVKLDLWFKSLASRLSGCEPPMLEVLNLPLLAECSLEDSLLTGPESETRRAVTEKNRHEELVAQSTILFWLSDSQYACKIHLRWL